MGVTHPFSRHVDAAASGRRASHRIRRSIRSSRGVPVRASERPTLVIAAGDVADEWRAGRYIDSASPDTVDLWVVPHTSRTRALNQQPGEWETSVVAFLEEALGPGGGGRS